MRIRRPRGITTIQFMVVTAIGVLAGVYVWQPLFLKLRKEPFDPKEIHSSKKDELREVLEKQPTN